MGNYIPKVFVVLELYIKTANVVAAFTRREDADTHCQRLNDEASEHRTYVIEEAPLDPGV